MARTSVQTTQCSFCRKILVNNLWLRERREYHVKYRTSICPQCVVLGGERSLLPSYRDQADSRRMSS